MKCTILGSSPDETLFFGALQQLNLDRHAERPVIARSTQGRSNLAVICGEMGAEAGHEGIGSRILPEAHVVSERCDTGYNTRVTRTLLQIVGVYYCSQRGWCLPCSN